MNLGVNYWSFPVKEIMSVVLFHTSLKWCSRLAPTPSRSTSPIKQDEVKGESEGVKQGTGRKEMDGFSTQSRNGLECET